MPDYPKRRIGNTRLLAPPLALGGAPIGDAYEALDDDAVHQAILAAHSSGIRLFDTSPAYGRGLSEHRMGRALRTLPKDDFILSTKVGRYLLPATADKPAAPRGLHMQTVTDYTYDGTMRAIDQSYQRLGLDRIDILLIHDVDLKTLETDGKFEEKFRETMQGAYVAIRKMREQDVVKAIGIGVHDIEACMRFMESADLDCVMLSGHYTILEQTALDELLPLCDRRSVSLLVAGPFSSGILATGPVPGARFKYKPASPEILKKVEEIQRLCVRNGISLAAAALQFPLGHPAVASVVTGAVSEKEVLNNRDLMNAEIPASFWDDMKDAGYLAANVPLPSRNN